MPVVVRRHRFRAIVVAAVTMGLALASPAGACTSLLIPTSDGGNVYARTMEFAMDFKSQVLLLPRNYPMTGTAAGGKKGKAWTTRYATVGLNGLGRTALIDGMNEKSLVGGMLYFAGYAGYVAPEKATASKSMAPWEFLTWALTSFATVKDIRDALDGVQLVTMMPEGVNLVPVVHFTFHDATGASIVIEPIDGVLKVYDNPFTVLTNSPPFDWHVTNLRNYVKLSPVDAPPLKLKGQRITPAGQGSGLLGMPGDPTPPSRFIRAIGYAMSAKPVPSGMASVRLAEHIINNFDIPLGWIRDDAIKTEALEYTQWSVVADMKARKYYVKTYDNPTLRELDLNTMKLDAKAPVFAPLPAAGPVPPISFPQAAH